MQKKEAQKTDRILNLGIGIAVVVFIFSFGWYTMPKYNEKQDRIRDSLDSISLEKSNVIMGTNLISVSANDTVKAHKKKQNK